MIHVCSLSRLHRDRRGHRCAPCRVAARRQRGASGASVRAENHLWLRLHDMSRRSTAMSCRAKSTSPSCISFRARLGSRAPLVVHCFSRHQPLDRERLRGRLRAQPQRDEREIAQALRRASPTATPNIRIVALADQMLGRDGRMIAAIETIGRGDLAAEANPFRLDLEHPPPLRRADEPPPSQRPSHTAFPCRFGGWLRWSVAFISACAARAPGVPGHRHYGAGHQAIGLRDRARLRSNCASQSWAAPPPSIRRRPSCRTMPGPNLRLPHHSWPNQELHSCVCTAAARGGGAATRGELPTTSVPRFPVRRRASAAAAADRLRGTLRHPLGGLGRRHSARARRHISGALFDRAGPDRARACASCSARCWRWRWSSSANGRGAPRSSPASPACRPRISRAS